LAIILIPIALAALMAYAVLRLALGLVRLIFAPARALRR